jgi:hypothetical protein
MCAAGYQTRPVLADCTSRTFPAAASQVANQRTVVRVCAPSSQHDFDENKEDRRGWHPRHPDFPHKGILFWDVTTLLLNHVAKPPLTRL